ncbi:cobalamin-binding protein [Agarivorans sp. TSD2052]|uniref:cobalamin-binding protein n=1 Tax=Agarivorans sp. TSD2052 TaxID=2937286 RepID=UPI00200E1CC7|nr:cobalamin-binding protein [Agarivorans sp. TSD2052]UPW19258.1 cobalamin-binding protein [Agarivorans sp. TSD2052]
MISFTLSAKPQRIISLAPHLTEQVYALGAGDKLIATVDYADYPEAAKALPRIGNYQYISLESVIALKPDLVLIWQQGNQQHLADKLSALNIAVYVSKPKQLAALSEQFVQLGKVLGEPEQGLALSQYTQQQLNHLAQQYQQQRKVSVFYQMWHTPLRSISAKSWINDGITLCGGENIMAEALAPYPLLSEEWVLAADPQAIIVAQWEFSHHWDNWPQLQAVKYNNIYHIDPDKAHRLTLRTLDNLKQLCSMLDKSRKKTHSEN